ncbi:MULTISPECIES: hypothetical protein [unclassified Geomicrobium]|uniref:hypothetical protein n=1 Tax=unclassified Geomicrobium TaxID=2628951 RepID=UPI00045F10AE|nr:MULTISPECIES: hypothetical protein [unclassified Geomicrobium]GAK14140.1 hypothetical protein JCM19039_4037 [Geomicrobium sp. JCM 19039]
MWKRQVIFFIISPFVLIGCSLTEDADVGSVVEEEREEQEEVRAQAEAWSSRRRSNDC